MSRSSRQFMETPEVWAATLAAAWAQQIGLPPGNLWEVGIARHILRELARLGGDANAKAHTEALMRIRLGLPAPEVRR